MTTNLQLVDQTPKPKRCPADQLTRGQFLAAGALTTGRPTEILFTDTYPTDGGRETLIVHRAVGVDWSTSTIADGNHWFDLADEADLAYFRARAERAQKIADIRALADWLEANPEVPLAAFPSEQVDLQDGAASVAFVRELGKKFGSKVRDDLDDRTQVYIKFGSFEYRVIAWHHDGRPAEPAPEPTDDPTGLAYTRADDEPDDPTPVSGPRVEPHVGGMTDEGLVDESSAGFRLVDHGGVKPPYGSPEREAHERDWAIHLPRCRNCHGRHHTVEPCR